MKVKTPLLLLLVLAAAVGYLLGTESGRAKRDQLMVKLGRKEAEADAAIGLAEAVIEEAEAVTAASS